MKMVEAAIVMPIILLLSFAIIYFSIFQFENLNLQVRNHQELLEEADSFSGGSVHTREIEKYNSIDLGGLMDNIVEKEIADRKYVINICSSVRMINGI